MDENKCKQINEKLDTVIRLISIGLIVGRSQREQILMLDMCGFAPKKIAETIGTTANSVRVELHAIRKSGKRKLSDIEVHAKHS